MFPDFSSRGCKSRANASQRQLRAKRAAALSHAVYPLFQRRTSLFYNFAQLLDRYVVTKLKKKKKKEEVEKMRERNAPKINKGSSQSPIRALWNTTRRPRLGPCRRHRARKTFSRNLICPGTGNHFYVRVVKIATSPDVGKTRRPRASYFALAVPDILQPE